VSDSGPRAATLKDVAQLAAVDPSTASRVLRGDPHQSVRGETRERILDAARVLRYRPNAVAQSLRTRRTDTFAVVVPTLDNPGFIDVVRGIQAEAADQGKLVLLVELSAAEPAEQPLPEREELFARLVLDGRADGLILAFATLQDALVARLAERGLPLVLVNRRVSAIHGSVAVDDKRGAELAVEHLISLGHTKIGYVGFTPDTDTARRRTAGYRAALAAAGFQADPRWTASGSATRAGGRAAVEAILDGAEDQPPTALFCSTLVGAIGGLAALRERGVPVPTAMSLVAFNDHVVADDTAPPLTTVRLPNLRMGREAMSMVIRAASGLEVSDVMIPDPPQLVLRQSTCPPPDLRRAD
jgi:LacI family transcriptional regulator